MWTEYDGLEVDREDQTGDVCFLGGGVYHIHETIKI